MRMWGRCCCCERGISGRGVQGKGKGGCRHFFHSFFVVIKLFLIWSDGVPRGIIGRRIIRFLERMFYQGKFLR